MAASARGAKSLKDYLKKYESTDVLEKKKKKKKVKPSKPEARGVLVVDEDPVWQKQVNVEEESENDSAEERPLVDEDIEVKRMRRLEQIKAKRAYNSIAEDGSGWITLSPNRENGDNAKCDISPPRRRRNRNDSLSPEPGRGPSVSDREETDLSPPRQRKRHHTPSPEPNQKHVESAKLDSDISPPRKRKARNDSISPEPEDSVPKKPMQDISPPRRRQHHSISEARRKPSDSVGSDGDLSPPRRKRDSRDSPIKDLKKHTKDLSPPRRRQQRSPSPGSDLSPPRKVKEERKTGLISGRDIGSEYRKKKEDERIRFKNMDSELTGQNAEAVFRDKITGKRISKDEYLKSKQKVVEKPKEIKLEWGKGLAQKRDAEARLQELELEKEKPFARTRDDPELEKMLKEQVRWGDPMAHLVKKKQHETALVDLGANDKMKESGFVIPQAIPSHSWIKRGLEAAPNRYGIKPGRHWDGVDRSNGYEKGMFKKTSEKQATEKEAYLWSVADM